MRQPISESQLAVVKAALENGEKITAIKVYSDATGVGMAEAKGAVDLLELQIKGAVGGGVGQSREDPLKDKFAAVKVEISRGNKIAAIRIYRELVPGTGLAEAKEEVEKMAGGSGIAARGNGCSTVLVICAVVVAILWIFTT